MKISYLLLETNRPVKEGAWYLRGFFGNKFREIPLMHHHLDDVGYIYLYPRIQYKVLGGVPYIIGIAEGADTINMITDDISLLKLNGSSYNILSTTIKTFDYQPKMTRYPITYSFVTPWLALNQKNNTIYSQINNFKQKKEFLNNILIGNVLSFCKGFGIVCKSEIFSHTHIDPIRVQFKGLDLIGFEGRFRVNFDFPDLVGIGKSPSFGFGSVQKVINGDSNQ